MTVTISLVTNRKHAARMALQKCFNHPWKRFVDPYWTTISGVLSHGRVSRVFDVSPRHRTRITAVEERPIHELNDLQGQTISKSLEIPIAGAEP